MIKKYELKVVIISFFLLSIFCIFLNTLSQRGLIFSSLFLERKNDIAHFFIGEEVAISEEKQVQSEKVEMSTSTLSVPIFVYHSVRPHRDGESQLQDAYDITPDLFEEELEYLQKNNYEVISVDELEKLIKSGIPKNDTKKRVVLTFDDGWENQYLYAFPLLKKYHMPAMFYVYVKPLGYKHFLTIEQLQEMKSAGMEIGSHTISHPFFKKVDEKTLVYEITESKKILETKLGFPVSHFAAPFGYSNSHIEEIIKNAGYHTGRTIFRGNKHNNVYALRGDLVTDSMQDFIKVLENKDPYH